MGSQKGGMAVAALLAALVALLGLLHPISALGGLRLPRRLTEAVPSVNKSFPEAKRPRIFIYPENLSESKGFLVNLDPHGSRAVTCFYGLDVWWPHMLKASPYLVSDPEKADYFWFPSLLYFGKNRDMNEMIKVMRSFGPYFDRKQGADHLWAIADDFGACAYSHMVPPKSIVIQHFGRVMDVDEPAPCKIMSHWADKCDTHIKQVEDWSTNPKRGCHKPYQDIVVPPFNLFENDRALDPRYGVHNSTGHMQRDTMFFLAGGIHLHRPGSEGHEPDHPETDTLYSWGVRQTVQRLFHDRPGWIITEGHVPDYANKIKNTKFCLAPAGWGWGGRMKASVINGCIPVIIQPHIKVEWEEQLPMKEYAIRLPFYMIYKLPEILETLVRKGRHLEMLKAMQCTWRFHYWHHPHGRAFDLLMCELKARLSNSKIHLNTTSCMLTCGKDAQPIDMFTAGPNAI